jgi:hypothetical protein
MFILRHAHSVANQITPKTWVFEECRFFFFLPQIFFFRWVKKRGGFLGPEDLASVMRLAYLIIKDIDAAAKLTMDLQRTNTT